MLRRRASISVSYSDEEGRLQVRERLGRAESELLQHELDHLDGILAIDLALSSRGIVYREAYNADPEISEARWTMRSSRRSEPSPHAYGHRIESPIFCASATRISKSASRLR